MHERNLNDTESEGMKKSMCVFMLVENGVALWLVSLHHSCFSVARSVDINFDTAN